MIFPTTFTSLVVTLPLMVLASPLMTNPGHEVVLYGFPKEYGLLKWILLSVTLTLFSGVWQDQIMWKFL
jgi:hypothetical protein